MTFAFDDYDGNIEDGDTDALLPPEIRCGDCGLIINDPLDQQAGVCFWCQMERDKEHDEQGD